MIKRIIFVVGATCVGKTTLLAKATKWSSLVGLVQVGVELRKRHPPGFFEGLGAMDHTEKEVREIFHEQLQAGWEAGKKVMFVDGQPRSLDQFDLLAGHDASCEVWWLHTAELIVEARLLHRFADDKAARDLALERLKNDRIQLYPVLHSLHYSKHPVLPVRGGPDLDYDELFRRNFIGYNDATERFE